MKNYNFYQWETPPGFSASALFSEPLTSGVYILHFSNGEEYVGQTVNFMRRFTDHRRRWNDIVSIQFTYLPKSQLDEAERDIILYRQRGGKHLRNLTLLSQPGGSSPLDVMITPQFQEEWLKANESFIPVGELSERINRARQRYSITPKFRMLMKHEYINEIISDVSSYVYQVIPCPALVESRSWVLTAMPSTARTKLNRRLATLSINNVEMLYLGEWKKFDGTWEPYTVLNIAANKVSAPEGTGINITSEYKSAGLIQKIDGDGLGKVEDWLENKDILRAARSLAVGQMRKGKAMFSRFHDETFADAVFEHMSKFR